MTVAAILLALRENWRILAPLAGIALVIGILAYARHQGEEAREAKAETRTAEQQATNNDNALKSAERTNKREADTRSVVESYTPRIEQAPGASDALDPVLRDSLCAGLGELRDGVVCEGDDTGDVPGSVPQAD